MCEASTPSDDSGWTLVTHATIGGLDTCVWHRKGSNQFCWRPVEKHCGAIRLPTKRPVADFIKVLASLPAELNIVAFRDEFPS